MTDNYYEIKVLRLKVIYLLAGWAVFIFAGMCFLSMLFNFLLEHPVVKIFLEQIHLPEASFAISFITMATLLLLYILIFSDWIRLRFWETWGLSIVFMIMTCLSSMTFLSNDTIIFFPPGKGLLYLLGCFLLFPVYIWGILSIYQTLIFLPFFTIGYHIRVSWLKRRKSHTSLSRKTRVCLYLLNLPLILGAGYSFTYIITIIMLDD